MANTGLVVLASSRKFGATPVEMGPKYTVIVPTFNASRFLEACLRSIQCQTYRSFEVLVMDGLSTDGTVQIVQNLAATDARFSVITRSDRGVYDAMNSGIDMAAGEWLYFLGADDELYDEYVLENVVPYARKCCDLIYGDVFQMEKSRRVGGVFSSRRLVRQTICHQGIFYRSSVFSKVGKYNLEYAICADWDLNLRCFASGAATKHIELLIAKYGGSGMSSIHADRNFLEKRLELCCDYFEQSLLGEVFRDCLYEFLRRSRRCISDGQIVSAIRFAGLFLYHRVMLAFAR